MILLHLFESASTRFIIPNRVFDGGTNDSTQVDTQEGLDDGATQLVLRQTSFAR